MTVGNHPPRESRTETADQDIPNLEETREEKTDRFNQAAREHTEAQLLADLRRVAREVDGKLTEREYADRGKFGVTTYRRRFGSWNAAKRAADLGTIRRSEVPEDCLIEDLRRIDKRVEGVLTEQEYADRGKFGVTTYRRRFGSWNDAKRAAGLAVRKRVDLTEEALADDLARLVRERDQQYITPSVYEKEGRYCLSDLPDKPTFWEDMFEKVGLKITPLYQKFVSESE